MTNQEKIHFRKGRKSDFLAGVDLEIFELEGKSKDLTIADVKYHKSIKVNGKIKERALIIHFKEDYAKPMVVNTTNATAIREITGTIDAKRWIGFTLSFVFDVNVMMMKNKVGGIRVKGVNTNGIAAPLEDVKSRIDQCTNKAELMALWRELSEQKQGEFKETFTNKLTTI